MNTTPLVIEHTFDASPSKIWKAITDKEEMKSWYFTVPEFKAEKGMKFQFWGGHPGREMLHLCEVTEVIPEKKLTHSWRYDGYPGNSFVTFELFAQQNQTLLRLTHEGLESFPDKPDFAVNNFVQGWTYIIHTSLKEYLEKK